MSGYLWSLVLATEKRRFILCNCNLKGVAFASFRILTTESRQPFRGKNWRNIWTTPAVECKLQSEPLRKKMRVLNVAEKNDAARTLAGFMSSSVRRREGFSRFNKIYEFDCVLFGQKCDMMMTSVSGHLLGYDFVGSYRHWKSCSPLTLFDAPISKHCLSGYEDIKRTLEKEVQRCTVLIIWTDCDREGENIGFEIINVCAAVKPNIRVYRAKFSEITSQSVKRALHNLSEPDKRINDAVEVRQELDLRIGASFTRFQTMRLQQVFPQSLQDALLSYGSCQFPTLGFVVERFNAIRNFVEEPFWRIKVTHEVDDLVVEFVWDRVRLFDELGCLVLYESCMENPEATVLSVNSKPKSRWRPLPLDTVEMEKVGSRKLRINAKEIMKIAEKLYTQGFISYPRTETNIFPKELNLFPLIEMQSTDPAWGEFASRVLQDGPNPRNGNKTDKAHPPIHPIKYASGLSGNERKVYEFVVRRFLACCSKDAEGFETVVEIQIAEEKFVATGLMITAKNYLEVYPYEKWNAKEIHIYQPGQTFRPNIEMVDGKTCSPKLLTEADLIALMEKHGIGTDATHADHIETIKSRQYVGLESEKYFVPGYLGMGLVEGYDSMGFPMSKPNLRAELEADLVKICEGKKDPKLVLREQLTKYKQVFQVALEQAAKIDEALAKYLEEQPIAPGHDNADQVDGIVPVMKCPSCRADMVLRPRRDGLSKFISCMGYPSCRNAIWFPLCVEQVEYTQETCEQCGPDYKKLKITFRRGSVPPPYPREGIHCIGGCDVDMLEILNISVARVRARTTVLSDASENSGFSDSDISSAMSVLSQNSSRTATNFLPPSDVDAQPGLSRGTRGRGGRGGGTNAGASRGGGGAGAGPARGRGRGSGGMSEGPRKRPHPDERVGTLETHGFGRNANTNPRQEMDDENTIKCNCQQKAIILTVKKDGPNKGRHFYKCGNLQGATCNFFSWADNPGDSAQPQQQPAVRQQVFPSPGSSAAADDSLFDSGFDSELERTLASIEQNHFRVPPPPPAPVNQRGGFSSSTNDDNPIECRCQRRAILLTVRKEGPNKGRQFYKCGNQQGNCDFFLWADSPSSQVDDDTGSLPSDSGNNRWQTPQQNQPHTSNAAGGGDADLRCRCGGPVKRVIVQKEGPNKGRPFYGCPKTMNRCSFFMWADEEGSSNSHSSGRGGWHGGRGGNSAPQSSSSSSSEGTKRKRRCGHCQQEGHTRRGCPLLK